MTGPAPRPGAGSFSSSTSPRTPKTLLRRDEARTGSTRRYPTPGANSVIRLTRLNGEHFVLNADLVQRVEGHPDTVITLLDDTKYVVVERVDEVVREIRDYRAGIQAVAFQMDRGEYRPPVTHIHQGSEESSVVPFPSREER
jgi:flagellar protein FlbD